MVPTRCRGSTRFRSHSTRQRPIWKAFCWFPRITASLGDSSMPFDWREYLEVARSLLGQGGGKFSEEAALRTLISRAYYAAYGYALRYSRDNLGFVPGRRLEDRTQDHGRLRAHLRQRRRAFVASKLEHLRDWRNVCDYDDSPPTFDFLQGATDAISAAEHVIRALPPPTPSPATTGS